MGDNLQYLRQVSMVWEDEIDGKATKKQLWQMLVDNDLAPDVGDLLERARDDYVRGLIHQLRKRPFRTQDDQGTLQLVSLVVPGDDGEMEDAYKKLDELDIDEMAQHLERTYKARRAAEEKWEYHARVGIDRFGRAALQALLSFALPEFPTPARKKRGRPAKA